jgi:hypothetical protein
MSKYQAALLEILASESFEDCMLPGQQVTPESIADDIVRLCSDMQGQLARLAQFRDYPDLIVEAADELSTNAEVLRILAAARLKLQLAAEADGLSVVAPPEGATVH